MTRKKPQSAMAALLDFTASDAIFMESAVETMENVNTVVNTQKNEKVEFEKTQQKISTIESEEIEKTRIPLKQNDWHHDALTQREPIERATDPMMAYSKAYLVEPEITHAPTISAEVTGNTLISLNPYDCILWRFSDRPSDELGDIEALARSMKEHGQQEPILVRKNQQKTEHTYEIIFGNRRWRAAQIAKIPLLAICKELSDQVAAVYQKEENENRKELSDYARAMSYRSQIDGGVFKSEAELSKTLGISKQALNDLMAYLRVPEELREAISNYKSLSKKMVTKLAALSKDRDMLEVLMHLAPKISDQSITTSTIDKHIQSYLMPSVKKNKWIQPTYEKKESSGRVIYKTKLLDNGDVSLVIQRGVINTDQVEHLHAQFQPFLEKILKA